MPFNMAWFKAQEEKKKAEELARRKAEDPTYKEPEQCTHDSSKGSYFNFHENSNAKENKHNFLSEELLVPHANNTDTQRLNMYSNHINQMVHLKNPEFPKVFTNFEDQVGEYSIAYKKADKSFKIIKKIIKNSYNYDLIVKYSDGIYDIIHYNRARNITEDYGYALNDCIDEKGEGDTVEKGEFIYKSDNYDDDGNFSYGVNLKALYIPWKNMTYEDGIVISESGAKKLTSYKVEKTIFSVNGNDLLLNLYGTDDYYKSFPKVGDHLESKILVALRRRDKRTALYDLQSTKMKDVDPTNDEIIYTNGGTVVDIDIFSNISIADLKKKTDVFNHEVLQILEDSNRYWSELAEALEEIIPCRQLTKAEFDAERAEYGSVVKHPIPAEENPNRYTPELAYYWKLAHENIDEKVQWRFDGKSFDNFKIQFTILKENPLTPGCKITNRYGGKGVITQILKDSEMPMNYDGESAEILLNPLGIWNRLNPSQLQEQYLNFIADHVLKLMKEESDYTKKAEIFFSFLKEVSKEEYDYFDIEYVSMNRQERIDFIDSVEKNGIYIHQPPFFGNTSEEQFKKIFREHPEWCTEYKFFGTEKEMVMGDVYYIRLKHESSNKSSMRSAANLNVKNLPAKSTLKKEKKILYSTMPLRLGEMEVSNLMISKRPDLVEKLLKTYSTNEDLREQTITQLLNPGELTNGHLRNNLDMDLDVDLKNNRSVSRDILERYLNVLGYSIVDNPGGINDKQQSTTSQNSSLEKIQENGTVN